ncbi:nose resistant to fluoxetine protein 6-like [Centruroides vittatus]|uniref:nose resistant to fluoxetine protein 6-like n=1 Tax=Centruroides vittatus TaxID=120091 RepID=UPI00350EE436
MKYERIFSFFLLLTIFSCYAKCNNTNPEDGDDFEQTSRMLETAEMRIKTALKSVLKQSLPYLMRIFEEVNVSAPCVKSSTLFLKDLMKLKEWPLRMIDSFGKLPAGMLGMTQWLAGDYDQCLSIEIPQNEEEISGKRSEQVRGKYCALTIGIDESLKRITKSIHKFENNSLIKIAKEIVKPMKFDDYLNVDVAKMKMGIRLDVCIPSTCSNEDLKNVGNWILGTAVDSNVEYCKIKDERIEYSNGQLISLIVLGIFIAWVALATLIEILMRLDIIPLIASKGKIFEYILSASPYESLHKLYSANFDESTKSMCGVKFLLISIVVLGHVCGIAVLFPTIGDKYFNIFKLMDLVLFDIVKEGMTMIESFFFYSGFMVMYLRRNCGRNSAKYYIMFLVNRVIR